MEPPLALLLLPRKLEDFILRDQAADLLRARFVVALEPGRIPYGAFGRMSRGWAARLAHRTAKRLKLPGTPKVVVMFHPLQYPLARAIQARHEGCEIWYARWDRYERAYDASPRLRRRLEELHALAAGRADLIFAVSEKLLELEREQGRDGALVGLAADSFPAPDPSRTVIAVSLGHLGWRTDWRLLREVAERMPELVLLLVGAWHEDECKDDEDFHWCRAAPGFVWLGGRSDEEAARLILCADVGIVPFKVEPFNDAALPYRILKYARLGRHTVAPDLAGVRTWRHAVTTCGDADAWVAALRGRAGSRCGADAELRAWALAQTALHVNGPLWDRLEKLGVVSARPG